MLSEYLQKRLLRLVVTMQFPGLCFRPTECDSLGKDWGDELLQQIPPNVGPLQLRTVLDMATSHSAQLNNKM
jgi:hypothetical protein